MTEQGVFAVHRGIFDHPIFAPEPFTEREAWLWMLSAAAWTAKRVRVGKAMFDLQRGQLVFATRFVATKWKWAHSKVVRFLKRLKTDTMVTTLATREATLITICNYDQYQFGRNATETQSETQTGTPAERQRNKEEELKKDNKQESSLRSDDGWPADFRIKFWEKYPNKVGKPKALNKLEGARRRGVSWETLMAGLESYIRDKPPDRQWLNPETFINQERWTDQPAQVSKDDGKTESLGNIARRQAEAGISFGERPTGLRIVESGSNVRLLPEAGR